MLSTIDTAAIIPTPSIAEPMTTGDHMSAIDKLIGSIARATYARLKELHGKKGAKKRRDHLDAARSFAQAGEANLMVAEWLAEGRTRSDYEVQLYLRVAQAKTQEGFARMAGTSRY